MARPPFWRKKNKNPDPHDNNLGYTPSTNSHDNNLGYQPPTPPRDANLSHPFAPAKPMRDSNLGYRPTTPPDGPGSSIDRLEPVENNTPNTPRRDGPGSSNDRLSPVYSPKREDPGSSNDRLTNDQKSNYEIGLGGDKGGPGSSNERLTPNEKNNYLSSQSQGPGSSNDRLTPLEKAALGRPNTYGAIHEIKPAGDINRSAGFHSDVLATTTGGGSSGSSFSTPANAGSESASKGGLGASSPAAVFSPTAGGTADQIEAKALAKNALDPAIAQAVANHEEAAAAAQPSFGGHLVGVDNEPLTPPRPATSSSTTPATAPASIVSVPAPEELAPLHGAGTPAVIAAPQVLDPAIERAMANKSIQPKGVTDPLPRHLSRPDEDLNPFGALDSTQRGKSDP